MDVALFFPKFVNDWHGLIPKWNILNWLSLVHGKTVGAVKFLVRFQPDAKQCWYCWGGQ